MRLARFVAQGEQLIGVVDDDVLSEISEPWCEALEAVVGGRRSTLSMSGRTFKASDVTFLPPLVDGGRPVFCVGLNYREHELEARGGLRTPPTTRAIFFAKLPQTMVGASADVVVDAELSQEFDWEVELGVVIGRAGRAITPDRVIAHLAGYTIVNDVTARDLQHRHTQWFIGKNVHASSPIGPWVTTLDEAGYPPALEMFLTVNGELKQKATTSDLIFDVATLVATVSRGIELLPGDVISTGTPMGVGFARRPPEFLRAGDVIETQIEMLGRQRNAVVGVSRLAGSAR